MSDYDGFNENPLDDPIDEHKNRYEKFDHLSPKVKIYWAIHYILGALVVIIISYFADALLSDVLAINPGEIFLFISGITVIFIIAYILWIEIYYRSFVYYIGEDELEIKRGVIRIDTTVVPYEKIQNINARMSWLERILGISTIIIETAGGYEQPEIVLPGVSNAEEVVSHILEKVKVIKEKLKEEENFLERAKEVIDVLDEKIKDIHERVNKLEETMATFAKQIKDIRATVPKNTLYKFNDIDTKIDFLTQSVEEIKEDLKRLSAAEESIEELKDRMEDVEEKQKEISALTKQPVKKQSKKVGEKEKKKTKKHSKAKTKKQKKEKELKTKSSKKKKR